MGGVKRQLKLDQFWNVKSRRASGKKKKNCIENLSNELFYEIFDYLNGYDIYQAFSNLNTCFENLVIISSYSMKIQFLPTTIFDFHYEKFLHSNKHRFISFYFNNESILDQFIISFPIDLLFLNLQSITLKEISSFQLLVVLFYLKSLPGLSSLSVRFNDRFCDLGEIYRIIFHLPVLKYLLMVTPDPDCDVLDISLPTAIDGEFSSIEYLVIFHPCKFHELINILSYTPRLSRLYCAHVDETDDEIESEMSFKLSNLIYLRIHLFSVYFFEFEMFLLELCSRLEFLNVHILCPDESYLDADRWEQLISHHIPSLNKFHFDYTDFVNDDFQINSNQALINRFTSPFWIQHKWIFKFSLDSSLLSYSIHPYKESWIDPSNDHVSSIQFTARDTLSTKKEEFLIDKIKPIFDVIQITCLNIRCHDMSVHMFIKILNCLPNLKAIRITDLPSHEELHQNHEDKMILDKFLNNNKLTKLTLRNNLEMEQIDLIINLFPRIQYLSFQYVSDPEIESIVQYTLLKIKEKNICHPMTICIFGLDAEHDTLQNLKQMIDSENLLQDYTINRQLNRFYLQWK